MNLEEIKEIEKVLDLVPPNPWHFSSGDDFDHWELWSSHESKGCHMVQDDAGVIPDEGFIEYILKSREIIEKLLKEVKKYEMRRILDEKEYVERGGKW